MKDYAEALRSLNQLQLEFPESDLLERGKLLMARTHAAMGNFDLALPLLAQVRTTTQDETTKREVQQLTAEVLANKKDYVRAIHTLLEDGWQLRWTDDRDTRTNPAVHLGQAG